MKISIYKPNVNILNMKEEISKIFAIFRYINGRKIDMRNYNDRLNLQKLTYILKKAGFNFSYYFSWYVKGPYSPLLASDAFNYFESNEDINEKLSEAELKIVKDLKIAFGNELQNPNKLELYASLLFIKSTSAIELSEDEKLSEKLISLKPWFNKEEVKEAIKKLRESRLFSN